MSHPLIFLDIDGVLNAHEEPHPDVLCGQIHRDKVELLNGVLRATSAKIVLSSAWRYIIHRGEATPAWRYIIHRGEATPAGMDWLLRSHGLLANRLIGITRPDTMIRSPTFVGREAWPMTNERGRQITEWRLKHYVPFHNQPYVAIDDLDLGITTAQHPLILTNGKIGLTPANAQDAIAALMA